MENENQNKPKPTFKLVQDKAYFTIQKDGSRVRKTKNVDLTVGWERTIDSGMNYVSFADSVQSIEPDVDGRIKLVLFPITNKSEV